MSEAGRATRRVHICAGLILVGLLVLAFMSARFAKPVTAQEPQQPVIIPNIPVIPPDSAYRQTNFISDIPGLAPIQDPLLANPWGISMSASSPFWIANNSTGTSQLIRDPNGAGPVVLNPNPQTITIPGSLPTGAVSNSSSDFVFTPTGGSPGPARFIFASITGNIIAWQPASSNTAQIIKSNPGNAYTGLALGSNSGGNRLYAADVANNQIVVFDQTFTATTVTGGFVDPTIPAGFSVYNIQNLGGSLYVTYAKAGGGISLSPGLGLVRKFNTDGVRDPTFGINNGGALSAPWGLAIAPASFGIFGGALLVGNSSQVFYAKINAYNPSTGAFLGTLKDESGNDISIELLWALQFGNGGNGGDPNTLYFTAGTALGEHGLFGKLNPTTASATSLIQFATDTFAIGEGSGHIDITVTRAGDASSTATVNVNTYDASQPGHASQKSDYEIALARVTFNPGETSKTVRVLIVDDKFVEGDETVNLALSNPTGAGVGLGSPSQSQLTITDNDSTPPTTNPIDDSTFFVRQHYLDFLNREPDASGLAFWVNTITSCSGNPTCIEQRRINASAAFFLSIEFQRTGLVSYLTNKTAFGSSASGSPAPVLYGQFEKETQQLQKDLVFGNANFEAQLEANKQAYFDQFVTRPEFINTYGSMTNAQYVDALFANAGISTTTAELYITKLTGGQEVPPTGSTGTGVGVIRRSLTAVTNAKMSLLFSGLTSDQTAAHIHGAAPAGTNAPIIVPLPLGQFGDFPFTFSTQQVTDLGNGNLYTNVHTTINPGGEIRGQFPVTQLVRDMILNNLNSSNITRAQALRLVSESETLSVAEFNKAFVTMEYFGYLRRDPDQSGFNFWLNKLNAFGGSFINAEMVKAFIGSTEYRQRFGPN